MAKKEALEQEALELERRLQDVRARLKLPSSPQNNSLSDDIIEDSQNSVAQFRSTRRSPLRSISLVSRIPPDHSLHALLLLSDSALPLGSFAFSNGLESYLAHHRTNFSHPSSRAPTPTANSRSATSLFHTFLHLSILHTASTALPFLLATFRNPAALEDLDDAFDASLACTVARRASTAQGRALVTVWERALVLAQTQTSAPSPNPSSSPSFKASIALRALSTRLRSPAPTSAHDDDGDDDALPPMTHAHLAPVFGAVAAFLNLAEDAAAHAFLLGQAKAVVSAAVRAGVLGPFAGQAILAGRPIFVSTLWSRSAGGDEHGSGEGEEKVGLQGLIEECIEQEAETAVEDAGVRVPAMDLWQGRHELLYSRIFNS
ncbi:MAG: hypothetical protein M1822_002093 [Bathelium mastoideum]|nr:MAG: hypothetical protein M1822_002093 [Bathelium mastoideum]